MKRIICILTCCCILVGLFAGCGRKDEVGKVYYLNFKPEQDKAWQKLADEYTKETGIDVEVVTAAQGTYEQTLLSEIDKDEAPTLFQVNGEIGLDSWGDYCMDLSETKVYGELVSDDFALKRDEEVLAIAYVYEGYGLITNKKLLKKAGYEIEQITSFEKLKEAAESITSRKEALGFSAFTSSGLASASSWRFSGHLSNLPLYYEFKKENIKGQPEKIKGTYLNEFRKIWDLYVKNSTIAPEAITADQNDAAAEFKAEKAVFYQNGTWEYDAIKSIGDENIGFLPIYFGVDDENQGICSGTENYWVVNDEASDADKKATLDFLYWVVTSETGTDALANEMGFVSPFKKAKQVDNLLSNIMTEYVEEGKESVTWVFNVTPNVDVWRRDLTDALAAYTVGKTKWEKVEKAFTDGWKKQYEASKR